MKGGENMPIRTPRKICPLLSSLSQIRSCRDDCALYIPKEIPATPLPQRTGDCSILEIAIKIASLRR